MDNRENNGNVQNQQTPVQEGSTIGWGILGFFIPLVGLILFLVWRTEKPRAAKSSGIGAIIGFVAGIILSIIYTVVFASMFATMSAGTVY